MIEYKVSDGSVPIILIENFLMPSKEDKNNILNSIFEAKKKHEQSEKKYYSYIVEHDYNNFLKKLYNNFLISCFKIFDNFEISKRNSSNCWAYCSNANDYNSYWHDHKRSSTINSVYYINIPKDSGGPLFFRIPKNNNEFEIYSYFPKNYDLIIFPDYLEHKPMPPSSDDYRICINMEIICETALSKNMFKKIFPHLFTNYAQNVL
jgi:hypothetical protein